jgi:DNA-binding transcriptional ArsR family regulator
MTLSSQVADFFAILGDRTRIRILGLVYETPLTVNEIRDQLGNISLQALSYQLKKLEDHHLIKFEDNPKDGRSKYIHLMDAHISHILNDAIVHIKGGVECEGTLDCEDNENLKLLMVTP